MNTIQVAGRDAERMDLPGRWITEHWGINRELDSHEQPIRGLWHVTHRGTGRALPILPSNQKDAIAMAKACESCGLDWNFTDPKAVYTMSADDREILFQAIQAAAPNAIDLMSRAKLGLRS